MPTFDATPATASADRHLLETMGQNLAIACPDMREMAHQVAADILKQHHIENVDPDNVYWHRFKNSESSALSYNGWRHSGTPIESWTLPQLVMHRFNVGDQDSADNLQVVGGFYTRGPDAGVYDETDDVRLLPQDVMNTFWTVNFKTVVNEKIAAFWKDHSEHFRTLSKGNFIGKAMEDRQSGTLNAEQFNALMTAMGIDTALPVGLALLQAESPLGEGVRVTTLDIAGYEATDILCIVEKSGRQFVYLPGETDALHVFDTPHDLQWWLMNHANHADNRARFMSHFPLSTHSENSRGVGLQHALDLMYSNWGPHAQPVINQANKALNKDPFTHLRDASKTRMQSDADYSLHSNGELRKQIWMGYLRAFGTVFGALAALDWPIALAAVGAGLADVGLNTDQAINGNTTAERKRGAIGAILGSIDVLFNSLFLIKAPTGEVAEVVGEEAFSERPEPPVEETQTVPPAAPDLEIVRPGLIYPDDQRALLAPFETNELVDAFGRPGKEGQMRGVYLSPSGDTYISIDYSAYQVRYVQELQTWVIIDPETPFSFHRNVPVRLNAAGEWETLGRQGLYGGGWPWKKTSVTPASTAPLTPYDLPQKLRETLRPVVEGADSKLFKGYVTFGKVNDALNEFFPTRERLLADANAFFVNPEIPKRPTIPTLAPDSPPKIAISRIYEATSGLVLGESHSGITSKRFLIDNMRVLSKQNVKTLYLEHLFTDLHQADLDIFASSGKMPEKLETYLNILDKGHRTDPTGTYTFINVVKAANENKLRIRAIDCMTSYRTSGLADRSGTTRTKMMNYFAHTVIQADQAAQGGGKWIALVGNSHANTFEGVAGVAELEGAIGMRVEDVKPGEPVGFDLDPGDELQNRLGTGVKRVKSDLRLRMERGGSETPLLSLPMATPPVETRLVAPGNFIIERTGHSPQLIHRSGDSSIVRTAIQSEGDQFFIVRPKWGYINNRRFGSLEELASALKAIGMKQIA